MKKISIVLNPGHGVSGAGVFDPGAVNTKLGLFEHTCAKSIVDSIIEANEYEQLNLIKVEQDSYALLPRKINNYNPAFAVSFHLNSFSDEDATGTEMLYWRGSTLGESLATILYKNVHGVLQLKERYKPVRGLNFQDRGSGLLYNTICPIVISEAYFISNPHDVDRGNKLYDELVCAYVESLYEFSLKHFLND